jgi:hypothetical protein
MPLNQKENHVKMPLNRKEIGEKMPLNQKSWRRGAFHGQLRLIALIFFEHSFKPWRS